jgi:hypothetical protein
MKIKAADYTRPSGDTTRFFRATSKVLLQEISTRRFLHETGFWTRDREDAMDFRTGSAAIEQAKKLKLANVQLVIASDEVSGDAIPLRESLK